MHFPSGKKNYACLPGFLVFMMFQNHVLGSPVGAEYQFGLLCQLPCREVRAGFDGGTSLLEILDVMDLSQSSRAVNLWGINKGSPWPSLPCCLNTSAPLPDGRGICSRGRP